MDLHGKRLMISGTSSTWEVVLSLAGLARELGARTVVALEDGDSTIRDSAGASRAPDPLALDVGSRGGREAARRQLIERCGGLDGAVHAFPAGTGEGRGTDTKGAASAFLSAAYPLSAVARTVLPLMKRPDGPPGCIVGLTGDLRGRGVLDFPAGPAAAVEAVTRYLACELGAQGVRVNLVRAERGRRGDVADTSAPLARAACFLLSDAARAVTGETLHVSGGLADDADDRRVAAG